MNATINRLDELRSIYSDMYKDAYGFRPRNSDTIAVLTEEALTTEINYLQKVINLSIERERLEQRKAEVEFEKLVADKLAAGVVNRDAALQQILQEADCDSLEFLCWTYNLPYSYFDKQVDINC